MRSVRPWILAAAVGLALAPSAARAQTPAPAPSPAPALSPAAPQAAPAPEYGSAPPGYMPYYAAPGYTPPVYVGAPGYTIAPPTATEPQIEMVRRNPEMLLGGVLLTGFGSVGLIAGASMISGGSKEVASPCSLDLGECTAPVVNPGLKTAGIGVLIGSFAAVVAGIPLIVIGNRRVPAGPDGEPTAWLAPVVRVGPATGSLTWSF